MARKANISKEEIIEACWNLIQENTFPNIPRLSEYFRQLDGRGCSNTTLLNGITEWEEAYREHQESEVKDISESFAPTFKRFERDVIQTLSVLLDEKVHGHEARLQMRNDALEGKYLSLSECYIQSESENDSLKQNIAELQKANLALLSENDLLKERNENNLTRVRVLESERAQLINELKESDAKQHQLEVNLAKQDQQIILLQQALSSAQQQIDLLASQNHNQFSELMLKTIDELKQISLSKAAKKLDS